jgi:hypothetical protein
MGLARLQIPYLSTTERIAITPNDRDLVFDTDLRKIFVGDGTTVGGFDLVGIIKGSATLDSTGSVTVNNANVTTADRIFLNVSSGNSNMTIKVSSVITGTSFTITSAGEADDSGLIIGWLII